MPMPKRFRRTRHDEDPLDAVTAPPPDETPAERDKRLLAEQNAKQVSDAIDEEINRERVAVKRGPKAVKILLLGQSESGKSTTLKNFQLLNSPKAFRGERASWRRVIQLNVIRSIRLILDAMDDIVPVISSPPTPPPARRGRPSRNSSLSSLLETVESSDSPRFSPELRQLKMRLSPLAHVEDAIVRQLNPAGSVEREATELHPPREIEVNSTVWKGVFGRLLNGSGRRESTGSSNASHDPNEPAVLIHACREDMIALWNDPEIQELLVRKKLRLQEFAGFFLDSLDRVTRLDYKPTDEDILKARIKTLGVTEYRFSMTCTSNALSRDWRLFDVGGQRSLVTAWAPFMDDVDAIIFLAPISCFDQVLVEDPNVNRLEDSVLLWKSVVSNPLLKNTNLVLFLNKCDILREKLKAGVKMADYIVSYGERPNDFESASKYLRKKFAGILKEHSTVSRGFFSHFTSVTDIESTKIILMDVQDLVIRQYLRNNELLL